MGKKNIPLLCILVVGTAFCTAPCAAQRATQSAAVSETASVERGAAPMGVRVSDILTMPLAQVGQTFGFPEAVASVRGPEAAMDDVVFIYPNGLELSIAHGLVWQVRLTAPESGTVHGITAGMDRETAEKALPVPHSVYGDSSIFRLPGSAHAIGLHLYWDETGRTVRDVYLFRADY